MRGTSAVHLVMEPAADVDPEAAERLRRRVEAACEEVCPARVALSLVLTGDDDVRALNRRHRGCDEATDVLSFPATPEATEPGADAYLGDVVISVRRARRQAQELGKTAEAELALLAVHGLLHLLGHTHDTPERAAAMEALERELGVRE